MTPGRAPCRVDAARGWPLHGREASRRIEQQAQAALAPHTLMQRAGLAAARLTLALAPHARRIWVAAGPGNNGGDGLEAAWHLHRAGCEVRVSLFGDAARLPADAAASLQRARDGGVVVSPALPDAGFAIDFALDALLGLGASRGPDGPIAAAVAALHDHPTLALDLPSGLDPDRGQPLGTMAVRATHTLALLTLKPGLFTAQGRDCAGPVWFDALGIEPDLAADARLGGGDPICRLLAPRRHDSHKGRYGDVLVVGGDAGMAGAARLAGRAAIAAGAGRVHVAALDPRDSGLDAGCPELMLRPLAWALQPDVLASATVVAGCGGGDAVAAALPALLHRAARLVLDADALNHIGADATLSTLLARRGQRGAPTVLTPHPLEAARLLDITAEAVQADRLGAAGALARRCAAVVLLKGSGSVVAAPQGTPIVNPTGNALLASAGTGDVLAGLLGALWAQAGDMSPADVAAAAAWWHGRAADDAQQLGRRVLTASALIERLAAAPFGAP